MLNILKNISIILIISIILLSACGKKGPIYRPNEIPKEKKSKNLSLSSLD